MQNPNLKFTENKYNPYVLKGDFKALQNEMNKGTEVNLHEMDQSKYNYEYGRVVTQSDIDNPEYQRLLSLINMDGKRHIRLDNRSTTLLGRQLDSQAIAPFELHGLGNFNTTEGVWFYISTMSPPEELRYLNGSSCRKLMKTLGKMDVQRVYRNNFYEIINYATWCKIEQNPKLKESFIKSTMPFIRYYMTNTKTHTQLHVDVDSPSIKFINQLRTDMRENPNFKLETPDLTEIINGLDPEVVKTFS